jgi:hypothetical protein
MLVRVYQTTRSQTPENCNLYFSFSEKVKCQISYLILSLCPWHRTVQVSGTRAVSFCRSMYVNSRFQRRADRCHIMPQSRPDVVTFSGWFSDTTSEWKSDVVQLWRSCHMTVTLKSHCLRHFRWFHPIWAFIRKFILSQLSECSDSGRKVWVLIFIQNIWYSLGTLFESRLGYILF